MLKTEVVVEKRRNGSNYNNVYIVIDGFRFEVVPHTRSKKETAYFYALLEKSDLILG